jgi:FdhD protein
MSERDAAIGAMEEAPVWISINGTYRLLLTCSPAEPVALAVGHLLAEGWLGESPAVPGATFRDGPGGATGVEVHTGAAAAAAAATLRDHQLTHGCGLRHFLDCTAMPVHSRRTAPAADLADVFRDLFAAADTASPHGGVHAAALTDGRSLVHVAVDVARHCAVDRALGHALLAGTARDGLGLVTTSRISGAIAMKAVRSGVAWAASRSLATPLARELATAARLPLLEQAARRRTRADGA